MAGEVKRKVDWRRLFHPAFWFQNHPTDWEWDATLNRLLDQYEPEKGYLTISLGGVHVWASNYPYAYGSPYLPKLDVLPSVATRKRLRECCADRPSPAGISGDDREAFRAAIAKAEGRQS